MMDRIMVITQNYSAAKEAVISYILYFKVMEIDMHAIDTYFTLSPAANGIEQG